MLPPMVRLRRSACDRFWDACISSPPPTVTSGNISPYKGGYNVGGGVMFGSHTKFFAEVRYHHMFTTKPRRKSSL